MTCTKTGCTCHCRLCQRARELRRGYGHCHRHDTGCHGKGCSG